MVTDITSFEKYLESSSGHSLSFYTNFETYRFKNTFLAFLAFLSHKSSDTPGLAPLMNVLL